MQNPAALELIEDLYVPASIKLYYDVLLPQIPAGPSPLLIAVHGYGAHKRYMMREARLVAPEGFAVISIQGPHQHFRKSGDGYRVGFGWLTDHRPHESIALHHDLINTLIDRYSDEGTVDAERVYLYGFSQACALNFRYAFTCPGRLAGVIGVCGGVPGDLGSNEVYRDLTAPTLYLYGDDDEFYSSEKFEQFDAELRARVADYRSVKFNAGHEITDEMRGEIRTFLADVEARQA